MGFKLAELFVDIKAKDDQLQKQVGNIKGQLTGLGVAIGTAVGNIAANAISAATSAIAGFVTKGITGAANLGESISKVGAVFGDSGSIITGVADDLAAKFGLSKQSILDAGAGIGLVGKAAGQSQKEAAQMGSAMAKLAADAASFYNVPLEEALGKIKSGLVGESEPIRAFGVLLSEEAVASEAVAMGLAKSNKEVDQQAKVLARASLITKGLTDATGDLERTQDSTANQFRKFQGSLENTAVTMGTALAPAVNAVINGMSGLASSIGSMVESSKGAVTEWAESVAANIRKIPDAWDTFVAGLAIAFLKAEEFGTNVSAVFAVVPENAARVGEYIANNWQALLVDGLNAVGTAFGNFAENMKGAWQGFLDYLSTGKWSFNWKPLLTGFQATADALPEMLKPNLISMDGAIAAVGEDLNRKITDRSKGAQAAAAATAHAASATAAAAAKKEKEFKSETSGTADFRSKLVESIYSNGKDTAAKQLAAQERIAKASEKTAENTGKGQVAILG